MDTMIQEIIGIEGRAREMVQSAKEESESILQKLDAECKAIEEDIHSRQERRLKKIEEHEAAIAQEEMEALEKSNQAKLVSLTKTYEDKKEAWTEEIFRNITAGNDQ